MRSGNTGVLPVLLRKLNPKRCREEPAETAMNTIETKHQNSHYLQYTKRQIQKVLNSQVSYGILLPTIKKYRYSTRGAMLAETDKSPDPLNLIWIIPA